MAVTLTDCPTSTRSGVALNVPALTDGLTTTVTSEFRRTPAASSTATLALNVPVAPVVPFVPFGVHVSVDAFAVRQPGGNPPHVYVNGNSPPETDTVRRVDIPRSMT